MNKEFIEKNLEKDINIYRHIKNQFIEYRINVFIINLFNEENLIYFELIKNIMIRVVSQPEIQLELKKLFGARMDITCNKYGNYLTLNIVMNIISPNYIYDNINEYIDNCYEILLNVIFRIKFSNKEMAVVKEAYFEEINYIFSLVDSICIAKYKDIFCNANTKNNFTKKINEISIESITNNYHKFLEESIIEILEIGNIENDINNIVNKYSRNLNRRACFEVVVPEPLLWNNCSITEKRYIMQNNKIILEFKVPNIKKTKDIYCVWLFTLIWGGTPFSKLILNLRDNMGVCYDCNVNYDLLSSKIYVECNFSNIEQDELISLILSYLNDVKNGKFTDTEFRQAKEFFYNCLKGYNQNSEMLEKWFNIKYFTKTIYSLEDIENLVKKIELKEMLDVSSKIHLETAYLSENINE